MHGSPGRRGDVGGAGVDRAGAQQMAVPRGQWQRDTWSAGRSAPAARRKHDGSGTSAVCLEFKWDEELSKVAQLWADQCIFRHDCRNVEDFKVGQNIAQLWNDMAPTVQWASVVHSWYDEVSNWSSSDTPKFRYRHTGTQTMTAHYTQVVWARSRFVGCGRRGFRRGPLYVQHYVCNYGPAGNYKDDPLYLAGAPCTLCPEDSECRGDVLCVAGAGALPDIYAHRYQHKPTKDATTTFVGLNVTPVPEDNELYSRYSSRHAYLEEAGKAFWDRRLTYASRG
ncbi:hypothetical protein Cfor_07267 [Coptotermes formosanus]|uniref:SCP domain-containing protein n=1 Tax=Coptotermes formosanus TaxID=36987 RepID=A0A6L2PTH5_COPFO|nr:hypothetical protein Cfor_07267 [Coptotermes formosanus]